MAVETTFSALRQVMALGLLFAWARNARAYLGSHQPMRIECGSLKLASVNGLQWQADNYFPEGSTNHTITGASSVNLTAVEKTLRAFPANSTPSCYTVPVPVGRYIVRLGFAYQNYDKRNLPPSFLVILQGTTVEAINMTDVGIVLGNLYYTDYLAFAPEHVMSICLSSVDSQRPILNSLEILPSDTESYASNYTGDRVILSTYGRINLGGPAVGPEPEDPGYRTWSADKEYLSKGVSLITTKKIKGTGTAPNYLPEAVLRSARNGDSSIRFTFPPVNDDNLWLLQLYFAELDPRAKKGERVFMIAVGNGVFYWSLSLETVRYDILNYTSAFTAKTVTAILDMSKLSKLQILPGIFIIEIDLRTDEGSKLNATICGLELFKIIPVFKNKTGASTTLAPTIPPTPPTTITYPKDPSEVLSSTGIVILPDSTFLSSPPSAKSKSASSIASGFLFVTGGHWLCSLLLWCISQLLLVV